MYLSCFNLMDSFFFSLQQVNTSHIGLSPQDAQKSPYIASMGVYVFKTDVLLKLLKLNYPTCNDFGSEIIPAAVREHNVQVWCILISNMLIFFSFFFKMFLSVLRGVLSATYQNLIPLAISIMVCAISSHSQPWIFGINQSSCYLFVTAS